MQVEERSQLKKLILDHIPFQQFLYAENDSFKIGIGHDLTNRGISMNTSLNILDEDCLYFEAKLLKHLDAYRKLTDQRKMVVITLCILWGFRDFLSKTDFINAVNDHDYIRAANELRNLNQDKLAMLLENNDV